MKYKIFGAAVLAGVLIVASCSSSDSEDRDSSGSGTTASQAIAASATPASVAATSFEPAAPGTEETSEPAVTAAPTPTTSGTSASSSTSATSTTTTTSAASSVPAEEPGTSEPSSTSTTTTTTSAVPATTTTSSTTTTTTTVAEFSAVAREQAGLRPRQRNDVALPLPDSVPRDRYVPGLAAVNLYTEQNESNPASAGQLADMASFMKEIGDCSKYQLGTPQPDRCQSRLPLQRLYQAVEDLLEDLGFTPQNVCGAPAGYSFTDLLKPTREMDTEWRYYSGDAIFTTDRLIELHDGERINPEADLDFYIRQAVQTAHDMLRLPELAAETEAMQLVLCAAWLAPSGEAPELANSLWYANLTLGIQPRESLLSQGTYHVKEISRNGNRVQIYVCHPTLGARSVLLWWREGGYRAELTGPIGQNGCQAFFEEVDYNADHEDEPAFKFSFGERVFSAGDLQGFPRS